MAESRFNAVCEAAAAAWEVPALAAGWSADGRTERAAVGCDPGTRFLVASVTKPLTASLVLDLLDPDDGTGGVWPADVRIGHLLSHTSGFASEHGDLARFGEGADALARLAGELHGVHRYLPAGELWSYCNSGYWLAAHLAAERAGEPYEDALTRHVLEPAGLAATGFGEPDLAGTGPLVREGPYPRARRASGGLVSTVDDLLAFGAWHLARPQGAALRVVHGKPVGGVYGLGLFGERVGGVEVWGHPGSYGGFQSSLLVVPDRGAVFAGLTNSSVGAKALRSIEDAFFEEVLGARRASPRYVKLTAEQYERHEGSYATEDGIARVEAAGDGLVLHQGGEEIVGLALDERRFAVPVGVHVGERFDFPRDGLARFGGRLAERVG